MVIVFDSREQMDSETVLKPTLAERANAIRGNVGDRDPFVTASRAFIAAFTPESTSPNFPYRFFLDQFLSRSSVGRFSFHDDLTIWGLFQFSLYTYARSGRGTTREVAPAGLFAVTGGDKVMANLPRNKGYRTWDISDFVESALDSGFAVSFHSLSLVKWSELLADCNNREES